MPNETQSEVNLQNTLDTLNNGLNTEEASWGDHLKKSSHDKNISAGEWNALVIRTATLANDLTKIVNSITDIANKIGLGNLNDPSEQLPVNNVVDALNGFTDRSKGYVDELLSNLKKNADFENANVSELLTVKRLKVTGTATVTERETLTIKDNFIVVNGTNQPLDEEFSGTVFLTGDEDANGNPKAYGIVYDSSDTVIRLGEGVFKAESDGDGLYFEFLGSEAQSIATRRDGIKNDRILKWNSKSDTIEDSGKTLNDFIPKPGDKYEHDRVPTVIGDSENVGYTAVSNGVAGDYIVKRIGYGHYIDGKQVPLGNIAAPSVFEIPDTGDYYASVNKVLNLVTSATISGVNIPKKTSTVPNSAIVVTPSESGAFFAKSGDLKLSYVVGGSYKTVTANMHFVWIYTDNDGYRRIVHYYYESGSLKFNHVDGVLESAITAYNYDTTAGARFIKMLMEPVRF